MLIDTAAIARNNGPSFKRARIRFLTGERREESASRSKYTELEKHRCSTRAGVDKQIGVLAAAIQAGMTVLNLGEMELA